MTPPEQRVTPTIVDLLDEAALDVLAVRLAPRLDGLRRPEPLLTTAEAAAILGLHPSSLARAAAAGRVVGARRVGRYWRFDGATLELRAPSTTHRSRTPAPQIGGSGTQALAALRSIHSGRGDDPEVPLRGN